jgi:hypothetical protein
VKSTTKSKEKNISRKKNILESTPLILEEQKTFQSRT